MKTLFNVSLLLFFHLLSTDLEAKLSARKSPKDILIIAHRGASGSLPEHTLAAKALAFFQGADYLEQDVVLTKDDVPIVLHDIHLDEISNVAAIFPTRKRKDGRYYAIDFSLDEIKKLKVRERINLKTKKAVYPQRFPVDVQLFEIPTLEDEITLIQSLNRSQNKQVGIYVEIKKPEFHSTENKDIAEIVLKTIERMGYKGPEDKVFIQCFHADTLKKLAKKTTIPLIQLIGDDTWSESSTHYGQMMTRKGLEEVSQYAMGIGPWIKHVFMGFKNHQPQWSPLIAWSRELKLLVHPYTFRKEELPEEMPSFETWLEIFIKSSVIDGLFTDYPKEAITVRSKYSY